MNCTPKRNNQEWLEALSGSAGANEQTKSLQELANFLFVVALNYLRKRQGNVLALKNLQHSELQVLAQEFTQSYMEKMCANDFALLEMYSGRGSFTAWAAQVTVHLCSAELRRVAWHRNVSIEQHAEYIHETTSNPEEVAFQNMQHDVLVKCLEKLPERSKFALIQCTLEGWSAADVAEVLDISANAVHILVHRARNRMRQYLEGEGFDGDLVNGVC